MTCAHSHGPSPLLTISICIISFTSLSRPSSARPVSSPFSAPTSLGVPRSQPPKILRAIEGPNDMVRGRQSVSSPTPCDMASGVFGDPPLGDVPGSRPGVRPFARESSASTMVKSSGSRSQGTGARSCSSTRKCYLGMGHWAHLVR